MLKNMKPNNRYIIVNIDEPYAEEIYEILKKGQLEKEDWPEGDLSFAEWIEETFGTSFFWTCDWCGTTLPETESQCPYCSFEENV
jgi:rubrerythrin